MTGQPVHRLEDPDEVGLLLRAQLLERRRLLVGCLGEDHALHDRQPVAEEHVLGAAQTDALGAELARLGRVLGQVGVGADLERAELVGPAEDDARTGPVGSGVTTGTSPSDDLARRAGDRDDVAFVHDRVADRELLGLQVDLERVGAADRGLAHPARDDRGVTARVRRVT